MDKISESGSIASGSTSHRPIFAVAAVLVGSFIANFRGRIFSIGLPDIRGALSLSVDEAAWLSTSVTAPQIFLAPAVAWLATVFGIRRVLIGPGLLYAVVSMLIPFARNYNTLLTLNIIHALLGTFWQWLYWQDIVPALLMTWLVYLACPDQPIDRALLANADWGGMLLFGTGLAMIFGLDQGNRLDWLRSGIVTSLLVAGSLLLIGFFLDELVIREPWARADVLFSPNIGLALMVLLLFALTNLSNSSLVPIFLVGVT
jgi:MFS transporter, DHA2 family, multidrug resistance protein